MIPRHILISLLVAAAVHIGAPSVFAINGGTLRVVPRNGWRAFEVISVGENPAGDGINYALPGVFDGIGAWLPDAATLRVQLNHETTDASISEINLNLANFQTAIRKMIDAGTTSGVIFVDSAQQAYDRWSANGGSSWINTDNTTNTAFYRFCSGQSYKPYAFGAGRGFADEIYITGEEGSTNRLFAIDSVNRDFYQISGVAGSAPGGVGGMPFDSFENVALLDTRETDHVALLLSPDGGTQTMRLYIGEKGKDAAGNPSSSFLARNGLAYGSHYYLNDVLPVAGTSSDGFFDTTAIGALLSTKLEDVDTSPTNPTRAVLGDEDSGVFTFAFNLDFSGGSFSAAGSSFSITKIQNHVNDVDGSLGDADNVDWSAATTLGGVAYPNGLIFVNEDSGTGTGETWMMAPNGSGLTLIADNIGILGADESSGVVDISDLVGYKPGSVLLTDNQGTSASLTVLIHPEATLAGDFNGDGTVDAADYVVWRKGKSPFPNSESDYNLWHTQFGQTIGPGAGGAEPHSSVPEPSLFSAVAVCGAAILALSRGRRRVPSSKSF